MKILGAGLSGLIAGSMFPDADIYESNEKSKGTHKALLRFRSPLVGDVLGIPFRKVSVHKAIYFEGKYHQPNIQLCNYYSNKVINKLVDRSIWNIDSVERWIAPDDFIDQLYKNCEGRIKFIHPVTANDIKVNFQTHDIISTIPMNYLATIMEVGTKNGVLQYPEFNYQPIIVRRWRIKRSDVFQTIYFPNPHYRLYRASITGNMLIAEFVDNTSRDNTSWEHADMENGFGINLSEDCERLPDSKKSFGKISKIDNEWRQAFILKMSQDHSIYSLGRFATWRNILLDDVINDISVIKKLRNTDAYTHRLVL